MKAKVVLKLDTRDDKLQINLLIRGVDMWCALHGFSNELRSNDKYGTTQETTWSDVREIFYRHMGDFMDLGE